MAKTRKRSSSSKEQDNNSPTTSTQTLHSKNSTARNKITKPSPPPTTQLSDTEDNNQNPLPPVLRLRDRWVTDEKIKYLIHLVENEKMTLKEAGKKANLGQTATYKYYGIYRDDPEHKIPNTYNDVRRGRGYFSYEKIESMINSIVIDKLTIAEAAEKSGMHKKTVLRYYQRYMMDPERKIPIHKVSTKRIKKVTTQEKLKKLIRFVENEHLTIREAAKRVDMSESAAYKFYGKYRDDPEKKVPVPCKAGYVPQRGKSIATSEQIKELIGYIVDDKIPLKKAAVKAKLPYQTASSYYVKYLRSPNHEIPVPGKPSYPITRRLTQEEVNKLMSCMVDKKMNASDAARVIGVEANTARVYYRKYLNDPDHNIPQARKSVDTFKKCCTPDQIKNLIRYLVNDKMSIANAAFKTNMTRQTARQYYAQYLEDPEHKIPFPTVRDPKMPTPEEVKQFFKYIMEDNLSIIDAGKKSGIRRQTSYIYYTIYTNDPLRGEKRPDSEEQLKLLNRYVYTDQMSIKAAAAKIGMNYTAALSLLKRHKENLERIPNRYDLYNDNLRAIAESYRKYQKVKTE